MKEIAILILFITLLVLPTQTAVPFVKCAPQRGVKAEYEKATMVFLGKVISEEERKLPNTARSPYDTAQVYRFQVAQWWKGGTKENVEIHVVKMRFPDGKYDFGPEQIRFQKGESYLVYGFANDGIIFASGCTRTRLVKYAEEDLQILGQGQMPKTSIN